MPELFHDNRDKDRVRDAADIVRVVGEVVALKPKGREFVGLCPFHNDHRPSMNVVPGKGIFHCFVCGTGGDVFSFVQKFHRMEFREALEFLAEKFGVTLTPRRSGASGGGGEGEERAASRTDLVNANTQAMEFFQAVLRHEEHGRAARDLIARRGIAPEMVERFAIGVSPDRWDGLLLRLRQKGLDERLFHELGLLKRRDDGGAYDALRNRLIFPIRDQIGRVIAFGGRRIDDADEPKYLNSPDTRLFSKSGTLYALDQAARSIQQERTALITEGYTDAIACHQAGFTHAVATLGTALTRDHATVLRRLCDTVVLLFDGDEAGQRAADRAIEVFFAEPLDVKICTLNRYTDAKDPDELLKREGGGEVFKRALAGAVDLLSFRFDRLSEQIRGKGDAAQAKAVEDELMRLVDLGMHRLPPLRKDQVVKRLASLTGLSERSIRKVTHSERDRRRHEASQNALNSWVADLDIASAIEQVKGHYRMPGAYHLVGLILQNGTRFAMMREHDEPLIETHKTSAIGRLVQHMIDVQRLRRTPGLEELLATSEDESLRTFATLLCARIMRETNNGATADAHWRESLARLGKEMAARMIGLRFAAEPPVGIDWTTVIVELRELNRGSPIINRVLPEPDRAEARAKTKKNKNVQVDPEPQKTDQTA